MVSEWNNPKSDGAITGWIDTIRLMDRCNEEDKMLKGKQLR